DQRGAEDAERDGAGGKRAAGGCGGPVGDYDADRARRNEEQHEPYAPLHFGLRLESERHGEKQQRRKQRLPREELERRGGPPVPSYVEDAGGPQQRCEQQGGVAEDRAAIAPVE